MQQPSTVRHKVPWYSSPPEGITSHLSARSHTFQAHFSLYFRRPWHSALNFQLYAHDVTSTWTCSSGCRRMILEFIRLSACLALSDGELDFNLVSAGASPQEIYCWDVFCRLLQDTSFLACCVAQGLIIFNVLRIVNLLMNSQTPNVLFLFIYKVICIRKWVQFNAFCFDLIYLTFSN